MALPYVKVALTNGQLGSTEAGDDGVSVLVLSGTAIADKLALNSPVSLFGTADLATYGITADNNLLAYDEICAFYAKSGEGAELWLSLFSNATSLATLCNKATANNVIKKALDAAGGRARLLGINKDLTAGYVPVVTGGIDKDVLDAVVLLQELLNDYWSVYKPARAWLPGLCWTGSLVGLTDLTTLSQNRVSIELGADKLYNGKGKAAIGRKIGQYAAISVNRSAGRVKNGLACLDAWFTDGSTAESKEGMWDTLHSYGYNFLRKYVGKSGFYFSFDHTCSPISDDYHITPYGRVIDKAAVIAYTTYINELLDDLEVDKDGKLTAALAKYFEQQIDNAVNTNMAGEISSFESKFDRTINFLTTGKSKIKALIKPKGLNKAIEVELGFGS